MIPRLNSYVVPVSPMAFTKVRGVAIDRSIRLLYGSGRRISCVVRCKLVKKRR